MYQGDPAIPSVLSRHHIGVIAVSLVTCIAATVICLYYSVFNVFPHLYYIPIVLVAYWYPRRGIPFSVGAAIIYAGLFLMFIPLDWTETLGTALRCLSFLWIGALVTILTTRLRQSEEQYRGIAENTGVGTLILDRDQIIRYANREAERLLGITDARGRSWMECVIPGERERVRRYHLSRQNGRNDAPSQYEVRMLRGDATEFFGHVTVGAVGDGYVLSFLDLTDRRKIEEDLNRSERLYRTIADHLPQGLVHIMDHDLRYQFSAGEGLKHIGLTNEELMGKSIFEVLDPEDARIVAGAYRHVFGTGEPVSFQAEFGGDVFLTRVVPLRQPDGSIPSLLALSVIITEQHRAEEERRVSEAHFRRMVERSPDPILIHVDGTIRFVNPAACLLFGGAPAEELVGKDVRSVFGGECRRRGDDWHLPGPPPSGDPPTEATIAGSEPPREVELIATHARFDGEDAVLLTMRDITARKEYERRIRSLNRQLTTVSRIVQLANTSIDLHEMLENILIGTIDTLGFDAGCIYLKGADQNTATLEAEMYLPGWFSERWAEIDMRHYPYNLLFYAGRPRYVDNVPDHPISLLDAPFLEDAGVISLAAVPLLADATVMGALFVGKADVGEIAPEERQTLEMIGKELGEVLIRGRIQEELMSSQVRARKILDILEHDFCHQRNILLECADRLEEYRDDNLSGIARWMRDSMDRTAIIYQNLAILRTILDPMPVGDIDLDDVVHQAMDDVPGIDLSWTDTGYTVQAGDLLKTALVFLFAQMAGGEGGRLSGGAEASGGRVNITVHGPQSPLSSREANRIFEEELGPHESLFRLQAVRRIIERYGGNFAISDGMFEGKPGLEVQFSLHGGEEVHRDVDGAGPALEESPSGEDMV